MERSFLVCGQRNGWLELPVPLRIPHGFGAIVIALEGFEEPCTPHTGILPVVASKVRD